MAWTIDYTQTARNQLKKLDKPVARRIADFLDDRVASQEDPRTLGKALSGSLGTLWRYRIGDYRVICEIQHRALTILVIRIGHRREVYR
ncbi:MAG: type II toxin-antitoxin system RelE/ParE family toxin [Candidatus Sulfotelmatobacter sp.]